MSATALLVFARGIGFFFRAPGFSHPSVPSAARAGLAFLLALAIAPSLVHAPRVDGAAFVFAVVMEVLIGAAIGMAASALYDGAYSGGRMLDDYTGIRGSVPTAHVYAAGGFGRIWSLLFTIGFFLLGGYAPAIGVFVRSFVTIPVGHILTGRSFYELALWLPVHIIGAALLVAGPAIALVFVAHTTLGAIVRVIPRFAAFTLSFPIVFGAAIVATLLTVPLLFARTGTPWFFELR